MGYETKLLIGIPATHKDTDNGIWFSVFAQIDMCKMGCAARISKIDWQNKDSETVYWYWYEGAGKNEHKVIADGSGDKSKPIPIGIVIEALKHDVALDGYSRFKWALDLLKAMDDSKGYENLSVMFYGH